jgi:hypothetical protein
MALCVPLRLGPFIMDPEGRLTPSTPEQFPSFRVTWRGHEVEARLTAVTPHGGTLTLQAVLGRVRSTGRPAAPETLPREGAFAAVRALPETLPPGWKLGLLPDHRILAEAHRPVALPTGAEDLVSELALFVLRLDPYLDLLAEAAGVEPLVPEGGCAPVSGTVKTCPG